MSLFNTRSKNLTRIAWLGAALVVIIVAAFWSNNPLKLPFAHGLKSPETVPNNGVPGAKAELKLPEVDGAILKDQGDLAFIQNGLLYILEGKTGHLTRLSESGQALRPLWSHDGQWLAYIRVIQQDKDSGSLWLVRRDGTQSHQVQGLPEAVMTLAYAWSPTENRLAVSCQGIWLIREQGQPEQVVKAVPEVASRVAPRIAWSPDGKQLAYSLTLPYAQEELQNRSDALYTLDVLTGNSVKHLVTPAGIGLVAWWPDSKGLLYWEVPGRGASEASDGVDFCSFQIGDKEPHHLSAGLTDQNWLSLAADGRLLRVAGTGRELWNQKWLELCDIRSGTASRVNIPRGSVAADPSFSPDTRQIAFVTAKDLGPKVYLDSKEKLDSWNDTRTLWVTNTDGSGGRPLTHAGKYIQDPQWSRDGKYIMYISKDGLGIIDAQGNERHQILGPFPEAEYYLGFYGMGSYVLAWYQG